MSYRGACWYLPPCRAKRRVVFLRKRLGGVQVLAFGIALVGVLLTKVNTAKD